MSSSIEAPPGVPPAQLGESPFWHPGEGVLYWCDIPGRRLHRYDPGSGRHDQWEWSAEPGCIAPAAGGGLVVASRDGLWRFEPPDGGREPWARRRTTRHTSASTTASAIRRAASGSGRSTSSGTR